MDNVLQILNYAANYRGNFMDSLKELDRQLYIKKKRCVYLFMITKEAGIQIEWIKDMVNENISVYFMPEKNVSQINMVHSIIKRHKIRVIHTHFLTAKQFVLVKLGNVVTNTEIVVHFHNHAKPSDGFLKRRIRKLMYKNCKMIGVSSSVTEGLKKIYPYNKCYRVDNAIDFKRLEKFDKSDLLPGKVNMDVPVCLIFGFAYERKGVDLALQALEKIINSGNPIYLVIALSTNEDIVKRKIVEWFGIIPDWIICIKTRNDVATLYRNVDVFLSPSREEGFCYSIVEAAYCGCRVVASKIPAQEDLQVPGVLWFESENVEELSNAIQMAVSDNKKEDIQEQLRKTYNLTDWAEKVIKVYEDI